MTGDVIPEDAYELASVLRELRTSRRRRKHKLERETRVTPRTFSDSAKVGSFNNRWEMPYLRRQNIGSVAGGPRIGAQWWRKTCSRQFSVVFCVRHSCALTHMSHETRGTSSAVPGNSGRSRAGHWPGLATALVMGRVGPTLAPCRVHSNNQ